MQREPPLLPTTSTTPTSSVASASLQIKQQTHLIQAVTKDAVSSGRVVVTVRCLAPGRGSLDCLKAWLASEGQAAAPEEPSDEAVLEAVLAEQAAAQATAANEEGEGDNSDSDKEHHEPDVSSTSFVRV